MLYKEAAVANCDGPTEDVTTICGHSVIKIN
jgi:hypothetical protein